jgi:hypothetical protein
MSNKWLFPILGIIGFITGMILTYTFGWAFLIGVGWAFFIVVTNSVLQNRIK